VANQLDATVVFRKEHEMSSAEPHSGERRGQYYFGGFTLDLESGFLSRGGEEIALRPKSFEVLAYLVERHGRLVSREELMQAVWPDVAVGDEAVTKCIADIRRAVEDDAQQLIRTVARRGYMFTAAVATPAEEFPSQTDRETEDGPLPVLPIIRGARRQISETAQDDNQKHVPLNRACAAALATLLIAAGIAVMVFRAIRPGRGNEPAAPDYTQLTNFTDSAFSMALSRDGRMLAFIRGENITTLGGEGDIYIKLLPDGEPVQLTHDGKIKMSPVFTPAGDRIVYGVVPLMTDPMSWSTWTVSMFGGEPTLLLSNASALTWIPGASPPRANHSMWPDQRVERTVQRWPARLIDRKVSIRTQRAPFQLVRLTSASAAAAHHHTGRRRLQAMLGGFSAPYRPQVASVRVQAHSSVNGLLGSEVPSRRLPVRDDSVIAAA
jgi:DNA-binding winged helix-turn-helix (wHTH) protein